MPRELVNDLLIEASNDCRLRRLFPKAAIAGRRLIDLMTRAVDQSAYDAKNAPFHAAPVAD
jgi:hypothetical protein